MGNDGYAVQAVEGGTAGGGSARQAAERRTIIDRLSREADWLEGVAADQRTTARYLATLSDEFSVLHDLQWADADAVAGADGKRPAPHVVDHLVAGPGGLFAIVTRRFAAPITAHGGALWVGEVTLADELAAVLRASQSLANALGTAVAPVMGFHGDTLPADAPTALAGVLLCPVHEVASVVERFPHTMLLPHERAGAIEEVMPLMVTPGSSTRHQQAAPPAPSRVASSPPASAEPAAPVVSPAHDVNAVDDVFTGDHEGATTTPPRRRHWPVVLLVLVLVAAVVGAGLWWFLGAADSTDSSGGPAVVVDTTAPDPAPGDTVVSTGELAEAIAPPVLTASLVCPGKGDGWQVVPDWPGDLADLSSYDIEIQGDDGSWTHLTLLESKDLSVSALLAQPPKVTVTLRATAVMLDLSRAEGTPAEITTPDEAC